MIFIFSISTGSKFGVGFKFLGLTNDSLDSGGGVNFPYELPGKEELEQYGITFCFWVRLDHYGGSVFTQDWMDFYAASWSKVEFTFCNSKVYFNINIELNRLVSRINTHLSLLIPNWLLGVYVSVYLVGC